MRRRAIAKAVSVSGFPDGSVLAVLEDPYGQVGTIEHGVDFHFLPSVRRSSARDRERPACHVEKVGDAREHGGVHPSQIEEIHDTRDALGPRLTQGEDRLGHTGVSEQDSEHLGAGGVEVHPPRDRIDPVEVRGRALGEDRAELILGQRLDRGLLGVVGGGVAGVVVAVLELSLLKNLFITPPRHLVFFN
jgi:hypothetical protein